MNDTPNMGLEYEEKKTSMEMKTDLIYVCPDDDPETFFKKLHHLSENVMVQTIQRFEKYDRCAKLLKFHLAALQQPELNVRLVYNDKYGWHVSSCIRSLPEEGQIINLSECSCEADFDRPKAYFAKIKKYEELICRCKLCKRYIPVWEMDAGVKGHEENMTDKLVLCKCKNE